MRSSRDRGDWILAALIAAALLGCSDEQNEKREGQAEECAVVVSDADCDTSLDPIVFVHGTFGSGDQFAHAAQLFGSNGYCQERIVALEYNSVNFASDPTPALDALIDDILAKTGKDKVVLLGHSQGTSHCISYLEDPARAAKVSHYVNLSGRGTIPDGVKALSISSENDIGGMPSHAAGAEKEITFEDEDHIDVASSTQSFIEIYEYLRGEEPEYTEVQCGDEKVTIQGIAESLGDNVPFAGGRLEVYRLGDSPRERGEPELVVMSDEKGASQPFELDRGVAYEFKAIDADDKLVGFVYFAPFKRSNRLARFVGPSENPLVAGMTTDPLELSSDHTVMALRNIQGSFRHDLGHSLLVNGEEVLTDESAGRTRATTGLFLSDQDLDHETDLGVPFSAISFLLGTDVFMDASEPAWIEMNFNGTTLQIPNWPSDEALVSVMFP
jgi:hypothetical protein